MTELNPELQKYFQGKDVFETVFSLTGKLYRQHKNRRTIRIEINNRGYFVKIHGKIGWGEILKNIFSFKLPVLGAGNELAAIKKLETLHIDTMKAAGFGERGTPPAWMESFLITEELADTVSLETLTKDWKSAPPDFSFKSALIDKVAGITGLLHRNGVNHRDLYLCHFLLDSSKTPIQGVKDLKIFLIDLHRVQIRRSTPLRWIIKDISGLFFSAMDAGLTKRDYYRFIMKYSQKPLRTTLEEDRRFWHKIYLKAYALYRKEFNREPGTKL